MSTPPPPSPVPLHRAQASLMYQLERVGNLHAQRRANPILAGSLERLARWQARRLRNTYADLASQPRYAAAITFFEKDLYGDADFARRDSDLARVVPMMVRMLPERVIATVADAVELNALSHELDAAVLAFMPRASGSFGVTDYCRAYREVGRRTDRERQITLIDEVGVALDTYVKKALIRSALVMMRRPAHIAGFGALHDFLERGFNAFRNMQGATEFLATIRRRELELMERILAGDNAPFTDPLGRSEPPRPAGQASTAS